MGSTRLPGKVMKTIVGKPMLALQIERVRGSRLLDEVIVATTTNPEDDVIEELAQEVGAGCFRGSEDDVLNRVVGALKAFEVVLHVELMGDSPIPDPAIIDQVIGYYIKHSDKYDYVSNALKTTYPPGCEVYVYPAKVLYDAESKAPHDRLREHVGPHIYQHPDRYRLCNLEAPPWHHYPELYLEVDTQEDLEMITQVFEYFHPANPGFGLGQVIDFMHAEPALANRNTHVERRWKEFRQDSP
jgi:spore coat polysaccharide biosynthesis protein SpsF